VTARQQLLLMAWVVLNNQFAQAFVREHAVRCAVQDMSMGRALSRRGSFDAPNFSNVEGNTGNCKRDIRRLVTAKDSSDVFEEFKHGMCPSAVDRHGFVRLGFSGALFFGASGMFPRVGEALVKGNAPPPKKSEDGSKPKCRNVEECQEQAERLADQEQQEALANATPLYKAPGGTRYKILADAPSDNNSNVKSGDRVKVYYRVLKLGKRSYDGVSGEGTVVFSRGYGLEDDEDASKALQDKSKVFEFTVGDESVVNGLNDGILGMPKGSVRRIAILPEKGWRKPGLSCEGGPGGRGAGGEIRTDYVVVPTATMVQEEMCLDITKQPFPKTYAQQRRMAQRFDQSLIMEVQLVSIS
jgi:FKBP-type peptidyl-prolyl cis-trans isomerase